MSELPSGTVTFLFTDIEGSTKLLEQLGPDLYGQVLTDQRHILRAAFAQFGGTEIDTQGDACFVSFPRATEGVAAAAHIQRDLAAHDWPNDVAVRVRMGLHTGEPWLIEEGYVGMDVHRAARIAHIGHGGQVLLSATTTPLVHDGLPEGVALLDLGRHRLKDLRRSEHIHQLVIKGLPPEFPPLTSLELIPTVTVGIDEVEARPPRQVGQSPYQGLAAFHEEDAAFFFGREAFTAQLAEAVDELSLVAVVLGSSGSGKSSTVFAGLLPQLREAGDWLILTLRPGTHPFHALATALMTALEPDLDETDNLFAIQKLADGLREGEISLFHTINRFLEYDDSHRRLLLILDQFEELYTLCPEPETRQVFTDELLAAVGSGAELRPNPVSIVVTLRADFMGQALANRPFADAMQEGSLLLGPMNRGELQMAIEKPAELQGAAFEPGLVTRILDDVGEEPGNLPLLEFALTLLWERMEEGWLTHEVYDEVGRVEGALARYADELYGSLKAKEQEQARRVFIQLVQPGQGTEDTRRVASREDLVGVDWGLVQYLADKRLVVTSVDESGDETVEVVHEALIRSWGQLRGWMAADRDFRSWQEGLRVALRGWEDSGKDDGALLRGAPLAQAEEWLTQRGDEIGPEEKYYIRASVDLRKRRIAERERRRRLIIGGLAVGLVVALLLSIFAFGQRSKAQQSAEQANQSAATAEAEALARGTQQAIAEDERARAEQQADESFSRELAAAALNNLDEDPELSILLALEGLEATHTAEALGALRQALLASRIVQTFEDPGRSAFVTYSPDGKRLLTSRDAGAMLWDIATGEPLHILPIEIFSSRNDFTSDGKIAITSRDDGIVNAWDVETGEELLAIQAQPEWVQHSLLSPDETILVTTGDPPVKLWDWEASLAAGEGVLLRTLSGHTVGVIYASFSPDGARLATTGAEDDTVRVWDVVSGRELLTLEAEASDVTFSPDGEYLVTGSKIGTLDVWDAIDGRKLSSTHAHGGLFIQTVVFSPDGEQVLTSSNDSTGRLWRFDPAGLEELIVLAGHDGRTISADFSPDGRYVATGSTDGTVRLWDISPAGNRELGAYGGHQRVADVIYSPDDTRLYTAGFDGLVRAIDANNGDELFSVEAHPDQVQGMDLSPDGTLLATASEDGVVKILDAEDGAEVAVLPGHEVQDGGFFRGARGVAFTPDGQRLVSVGEDGLGKIWDVETGEELWTLDGHEDGINWVTVDANRGLLATASADNSVRVWDTETGEFLFAFAGVGDDIYRARFTNDGTHLWTGDSEGLLAVWAMPDNPWNAPEVISEAAFSVPSGAGWILGLTFSHDGSLVAVNGTSGFVELRDAETGELLETFVHPAGVYSSSFTSDGKRLATGGFDGLTRVFILDLDDLIALAERRVTRSLTEEECRVYLHLVECP